MFSIKIVTLEVQYCNIKTSSVMPKLFFKNFLPFMPLQLLEVVEKLKITTRRKAPAL